MRDALQSYLTLAGGLTGLTRQRAVGAAKALVAQGEATAEQVQSLAEDLLSQTRQNSEAVTALVRYEVERALARLGLASGDEVVELLGRVQALEEQLRMLQRTTQVTAGVKAPVAEGPRTGAPADQASADKPARKRAPAKTSAAKATPSQEKKKARSRKTGGAGAPATAGEAPAEAPTPPASTAPASTAPASTAPASTAPASTAPPSTTSPAGR